MSHPGSTRSIAATVLDRVLWIYQAAVSPFLAPACRFEPRCSDYGRTAIERHGAIRGGWLMFTRICRCHPWHAGGWDPVQ